MLPPGLPAHVTVRGNNRDDTYHCEGDRLYFLRCLQEAASANSVAVHAYVLMSNHVHILGTPQREGAFGRAIQNVGRRYVAYFNERHDRTGTLWEGRFRSTVVEADAYLFACHRYIDLNPVRAGIVPSPKEYRWSSHNFYARGEANPVLTPHPLVQSLGLSAPSRQRAYAALFEEAMDSELLDRIRFATRKSWALGTDAYCRTLEDKLGRRVSPETRGWQKGRRRQ
jgi:putative transposase